MRGDFIIFDMPCPIAPELETALAAADLLGLPAVVLDLRGQVLAGAGLTLDPAGIEPLLAALADRRHGPIEPLPAAAGRWLQLDLSWPAGAPAGQALALVREVGAPQAAEPTFRRERDRLCWLADSAPVLMAYCENDALRCSYANRAFVQSLCPAASERGPIGQPLAGAVTPDLADWLQAATAQLERDGEAVCTEQWLTLADGTVIWAELTLAPHVDARGRRHGLYLLVSDHSRHHHAERALLESEERLARFMQAGVEGIVFHRDGHIVDANPALCTLIGQSLHELLERPLLGLIAPEFQPRLARRLDAQEDLCIETSLIAKDGRRIPVELIERGTLQRGTPMRMTVLRDIRERRDVQDQLHYLEHHDALTGLANRHALFSQLEHLMVAARASDTRLALLFIDLDHFKRVNDSLGHAAGDALLKTLASRLGERVRSTDRVARFGGDEFIVLLPGVRSREAIAHVARKLLEALARPVRIAGSTQDISITPSIGIAVYPDDGDTPDVLIQHADAALHAAKARGRAHSVFFEPRQVSLARDNLVLEGQLGQAIAQEEFALLFQPQVCARDGRFVGVEALIRWNHPERGLLVPDAFIALAEQHRLIVPIGAWVLREAARQARLWHEAGLPLTVAVNLSTLQFQAPDFIASIEQLLAETALPPGWLELELTERMLMDDVPGVLARLAQLRQLGVKLSVDDFGTGYSSLSHLKELPIDKMKIDRSFVRELPQQRESAAIAGAIIELARGLGLTVVAEGVETEAQREFLLAHGCDQLQGMGIGAPMDAAALASWQADRRAADQPPGNS